MLAALRARLGGSTARLRPLRLLSSKRGGACGKLIDDLCELPSHVKALLTDTDALPQSSGLEQQARPCSTTPCDRVPWPHRLPRLSQVFCNREIRMDRVKVIGFDYDYTLASYKSTLQRLVYEQARQHLVERQHYPAELAERSYDPSFAIRGLVFDRHHGVLLKLSYAQAIAPDAAYRGRQRMSRDELRRLYGEALQLDPAYIRRNMRPLNDLFALSEVCLLADVVQLAVDSGTAFDAAVVGDDVSKAIVWVHMSGAMHDTVAANPEAYLHPSPRLGGLLRAARESGKSLFLLTNSGFDFVDHGMRFLVGPGWRELFDVVIVSAQKPHFYKADSPFRAISQTGEGAQFLKWRAAVQEDLGGVRTCDRRVTAV